MNAPHDIARRMFDLIEPVALVAFFSEEPNDEMAALGFTTYWDGYFAGRAAPLGRAPAEVVDAAFYSFGPGEVARHVPKVWDTTTPEEAHAARQRGCVAALRRILGDLADSPGLARAADLLARAATGAPLEGRVMYAALRSLPLPTEPVARLWFAANMLREHRADGHVVALMAEQVDRTESHVLLAIDAGVDPPESFGRIHHLPQAYLDRVMAGLRSRGLLDPEGRFTAAGRATKDRVEALTDALAAAPYVALPPADLDELVTSMEPIAARLVETGSRPSLRMVRRPSSFSQATRIHT
ncbi:MarR family transcriptional regulator [Nocardioides cavernae]|uniref:SCO6745 family protein n=1 Tax=Nocardioides TaxID=1839 RepID=UPI000A838AE9|nr:MULTISPECIES: MarR family transcriptional regulator [Nocardioides]MCK9824639.1 MarR family transcriptional regulator [Nocardioides cavernae]